MTSEQLAKLRICEHGTHQIDENVPGLNRGGKAATSCPSHPTFNRWFALRTMLRLFLWGMGLRLRIPR